MKKLTCIFAAALLVGVSLQASAQVSRKTDKKQKNETAAGVTQRMRDFYEKPEVSDASKMWERIIYRQIDLTQTENLALYYPDEPVDLFHQHMSQQGDGDASWHCQDVGSGR